jgi:ABC transport system ATP-binding/permease protein
VVGVNGSGKTTFLNVLAGRTQAGALGGLSFAGEVVFGSTVRLGYLTQEPGPVEPDLRVLEAAQQVRGSMRVGKRELTASQLLDRLGLSGDRQWARVADLSGGERRRLQLQIVLMDEPNVLLLDEPTNDLDIETLTELEDLLDGFPGSLVVVSHDRYFTERVTDHVLALVDGKLAFLPGGIEEYLALRDAGLAGQPARPAPDTDAEVAWAGGSAGGRVAERRSAGETRAAKKELARLERQLKRLSARESELHEELARAAADYERLIALGDELKAVQAERTSVEDRWLEISDQVG